MLYGYVAVYWEESVRGVTSYQSSTWIRKVMNRIATDFQARWKWQGSPKSWHTNLHRQKMTNMWRPLLKGFVQTSNTNPKWPSENEHIGSSDITIYIHIYISFHSKQVNFCQSPELLRGQRLQMWVQRIRPLGAAFIDPQFSPKSLNDKKITVWAILLETRFT